VYTVKGFKVLTNISLFTLSFSSARFVNKAAVDDGLSSQDTHNRQSIEALKNIFRQGHSLKEAFFYGQKHYNNSNDDTLYIFARSETFLMSPVDIPCSFNLGNTYIITPRWMSFGGYNDRFAIAGPESAKVYATKIEGYKQAILARRSNNQKKPLLNSESLRRDWLLGNKLNVTEHEDDRAWALLRLRADRSIAPLDVREFKIGSSTSLPQLALQKGSEHKL